MGKKTEAQEAYPDQGLEGVRGRAWDTSERDKTFPNRQVPPLEERKDEEGSSLQ